MPTKKMLTAGFTAGMMVVLILDGQASLQSASSGIILCLKTVIPSLFPFLFLCSVITSSLWGESLLWLRSLSARLGIPAGGESLLVSAFLGGYPTGAQTIGNCFQEGRLSRQDAQRLLPLCNNAGPAFLFGMVALQFRDMQMIAALWLIQILSVLCAGTIGSGESDATVSLSQNHTSVSAMLNRAVRTMGFICGWIILFQILISFLDRWILWYFPREIQILVRGLLELSSGCCELHLIPSPALRFLICTVQLTFGGICVIMQTSSVIGSLSLARYLRGKLMQTVISLVLAVLYLQWGWMPLFGVVAVILFSPVLMKNSCRFSASSGV